MYVSNFKFKLFKDNIKELNGLSTETATVKRLCYWCGPLAEQVNRSPRAPPCDASTEPIITGCEPEFPYCAVVATSPRKHIIYKQKLFSSLCLSSTRTEKTL